MMIDNKDKVMMISGCLMGVECRYDGRGKEAPGVLKMLEGYRLVPFCPEAAGGLRAPRPPAEIREGDGAAVLAGKARVLNREGRDCTAEFIRGAEAVLETAREVKPWLVVLKAKSPSCGVGLIYDGSFSGQLKAGDGVTAALLRAHGLQVCSELDLERFLP